MTTTTTIRVHYRDSTEGILTFIDAHHHSINSNGDLQIYAKPYLDHTFGDPIHVFASGVWSEVVIVKEEDQ